MPDAPPQVPPGPTTGGDGPMSAAEIDSILADFRAWLEAGGVPAPEPVGLLTLAREFTALRHEVNLQTKASRAAVGKLSEQADPREGQRLLVQSLVDIADALATGLQNVEGIADTLTLAELTRPPTAEPGWFARLAGVKQTGLADWAMDAFVRAEAAARFLEIRRSAIADGYALSLKRVERALTAAGLEPIPTVGERFDPTTMEAVELADGGDAASGIVLAESRRGYRWGGEVFRFARVTVAR